MIKTEFGIIENIEQNKDYSNYEPEKYNCIFIDDNLSNKIQDAIERQKYMIHFGV